jgi:hypothetical protein
MNYSLSSKEEDNQEKALKFLLSLKGSRNVLSYSDAVGEVKANFNMSEEEAKEVVNEFRGVK